MGENKRRKRERLREGRGRREGEKKATNAYEVGKEAREKRRRRKRGKKRRKGKKEGVQSEVIDAKINPTSASSSLPRSTIINHLSDYDGSRRNILHVPPTVPSVRRGCNEF